ncbi:uncharacterized protein LOC134354888 isoform X2 [Mobula hypostoma]|uniref:uncharacterized protein LOC134354888 isoform X2 n=1 Tax=Mobula hypostoma TaxID=723540 RepID=UPI002FC3B12B
MREIPGTSRRVIKEKLSCGVVPCLNHGKCTAYPFSRLGFLCICPPGFYGDLCQHRSAEPFTVISLIGVIAIPILILALCFAICCICNRERLHHQAFKKNFKICLNPSPATCKSKSPRFPCPRTRTPCPRTSTYQESCKRRDNTNPFEPENADFLRCGTRNDPRQYNPELTATPSSVATFQRTNKVERSAGSHGPCPEIQPSIAPEENQRKSSSHSISQSPCPAVKQHSAACQTDPEAIDQKSHIGSKSPCPAVEQSSVHCQTDSEAVDQEISTSHIRSKSPCPAVKQRSVKSQTDPEDVDRKLSLSHVRSKSPCPEIGRVEAMEEGRRISSPSINRQDPYPVANQSSVMENEYTEVAEKKEKPSRTRSRSPCSEVERISTSTRSQCPYPAGNQGTIVKNARAEERKEIMSQIRNQSPCPEELQSEQPIEGRRTSLSSIRCVPCPVITSCAGTMRNDNQLTKGAEEGSQIYSTYDPSLDCCSAYEFNCLEGSIPDAHEDSECRTGTVGLGEQMFVEECQFHYPASREPSEDCEYSSNNAPCLDEVQQTSNFQCKSGEIILCNDTFDNTTSSQSSYQDYLSPLPTDISTPRSESSSQMSSSSEIADDFGNKSEYSLNSSIPSEAFLNLMQSYFGNGDDVKSVKISILLDNSQSDDLSNSTNVKETTNRISYQMNSPLSSEGHSEKGLQNNCYFLDGKDTLADVESSMASVARSHTSLEPEFNSLTPTMVIDSIDCYCAKDKEPCSKTTTVRYMFTDSETEA